MNDTKKEFTKIISAKNVFSDTSAEYVLPDYNGDVRKILFTKAEVRPSGKFASGDEIEFSGIVVYSIVYSDSENNIASVSFTSDYDYSAKCSEERYKDAFADTRIANYQVRLLGPRKISAKASVVGSVSVLENCSLEVGGSAFDGDIAPEMATRIVKMRNAASSSSVEREYAESIEHLDGAIADEVNVVYAGADASVDNIEIGNDEVTLLGKLRMVAIISNGDSPAYLAEKTIPIDVAVPFEGVSEDMKLLPEITVSSVRGNVNADDTGSDVVVSAILEFSLVGEQNEELELITDAYTTTCVTENIYADFPYEELIDVVSIKDNYSAEMARDGIDTEHIREVVFTDATLKLDEAEMTDEGINLRGEMKITGITSDINDDGSVSYSNIKFAMPYSKNVKYGLQNLANLRVDAKGNVINISATVDSEKIYISASLDLSLSIVSSKCERVLAASTLREELSWKPQGSRITVYYPSDDETLFSVAKKFHTTVTKVANDNSLTDAVNAGYDTSSYKLSSIKRLIIT